MRKVMFGAALVAAMAAPALAHADDLKGSLGVHYNNWDPDNASNVDLYALDGSISNQFSNGWTVQGDASNERLDIGGASLGSSYGAVSAGVRNDQYALYGFVSLGSYTGLSGSGFGAGGQLYLNNVVLDGSVGYTDFSNAHAHATHESVDGTYFINDNFGVTGTVSHADLSVPGPDVDNTAYGVSGSYRFAAHPVTLSLGYTKNDIDSGDVNVWHVGFAWDFGSDSLRDRATHGPSWNGAASMFNTTQLVF